MSAIAVQLTKTGARIRLKITDSGSTLGAAQAFSAGKVDLAVVRADLGDLSAARTLVRVTHGGVIVLVPPGSSAKGIEGLAGKTVGVVDEEMNHRFVEVLTHEYDLARAKVRFKNLLAVDAQHALQSNQVGALLVVVPISEKHVSLVRSFFPTSDRGNRGLAPTESAGAIENLGQAYEPYHRPKASRGGSPPTPADDLTPLRVPFSLVANKKLNADDFPDLTRAIRDARR